MKLIKYNEFTKQNVIQEGFSGVDKLPEVQRLLRQQLGINAEIKETNHDNTYYIEFTYGGKEWRISYYVDDMAEIDDDEDLASISWGDGGTDFDDPRTAIKVISHVADGTYLQYMRGDYDESDDYANESVKTFEDFNGEGLNDMRSRVRKTAGDSLETTGILNKHHDDIKDDLLEWIDGLSDADIETMDMISMVNSGELTTDDLDVNSIQDFAIRFNKALSGIMNKYFNKPQVKIDVFPNSGEPKSNEGKEENGETELRNTIANEIRYSLVMAMENCAGLGRDAYGDYIGRMVDMIQNQIRNSKPKQR